MTETDTRQTLAVETVPRPRAVPDPPAQGVTGATELPAAGEFPWPEPWHLSLGARPRSEFWDAETAGWRSPGPIPRPRHGD